MIPNISRKPHALEKSGSRCTVVARPLFWDLIVFWLFCGIPHYDRVMQLSERLEIWTGCALGIVTWSWKKISKWFFHPKKNFQIFSKKSFKKKFFTNLFSNFSEKFFFLRKFFWFFCSKIIFGQIIFNVAEINLMSGVYCILVLFILLLISLKIYMKQLHRKTNILCFSDICFFLHTHLIGYFRSKNGRFFKKKSKIDLDLRNTSF